jgi:transposase InsO family protein
LLSKDRNETGTGPGIEPSVGSVGDAYDNALAETINGLYKTEVIPRRSSWKTMEEVELETLKWPYGDESIAYRLTGRLVQQPPPA